MKTLNVGKLLFMLMIVVGMSACGDEYYTDDYLKNSDEKLCGKEWVEEYTLDDGRLCKYQLKFAIIKKERTGQETWVYYRQGESRPYETKSKNFSWKWIDNMEAVELNYGAGEIVYFENVWVRENYLSGKLDGVVVMLADSKIFK